MAVLAALYFAVGSVHVRAGTGSVHLQLTGLLALLLGWRAIVPVTVGIVLQAVLLQHGGLLSVGVNALVQGLPAALVGALLARRLEDCAPGVAGLLGAVSTILCGALSLIAVATLFWVFDPRLLATAGIWMSAHAPVLIGEALMTASALAYLMRVHPGVWKPCGEVLASS